jgi:DNA-directed RNA polymerase specialized sigma24 family protein
MTLKDQERVETPWWFGVGPDDEDEDTFTQKAAVGHRRPASHRPETALQALMEARPLEEPETSKEELVDVGDALAFAVDGLSHPDRYVVEQVVIAKRSLRSFTYGELFDDQGPRATRLIPKSTIHRWKERGLATLRQQLADDPAVKRHFDQ